MNLMSQQPSPRLASQWGNLLGGLMVLLALSVGALLPVDAPTSATASPAIGPLAEAQPVLAAPIAPASAQEPAPLFTWDPHAKRRPAPAPATEILLDLPTLTVTADPTGNLTAAGLTLPSLGNVADMGLSPDLIATLSAANIQHIQLATDTSGLAVETNNLPILGLAWDEASLAHGAQLMADAGVLSEIYVKSAPLLTHIHLDLVADLGQLTRTAQQTPIPVDVTMAQADTAALAGQDAARINLPIYYLKNGTPFILGLDADQWEALTGVPAAQLRFTPAQLQTLQTAGIKRVHLSTEPDGVHVTVNDGPLPTLLWGQGEIHNLTVLADALAGTNNSASADTLATIDQLVQALQAVNVGLDIRFP